MCLDCSGVGAEGFTLSSESRSYGFHSVLQVRLIGGSQLPVDVNLNASTSGLSVSVSPPCQTGKLSRARSHSASAPTQARPSNR